MTVDPADLMGPRRNYDAGTRTWNFPDPWEGGDWGLPDIVDYMESGALALLENAAANRRYWLENYYGITSRAVAGTPSGPAAWVVPAEQENEVEHQENDAKRPQVRAVIDVPAGDLLRRHVG